MNPFEIIDNLTGPIPTYGGSNQPAETKVLQAWQIQQKEVATGVTSPEKTHSATYVALIEELEAENRMLRARNERLTMAMKHLERIIQENVR